MNVSVAIVARDAAGFLPQCLSSVKDLSDDVIVVVDKRTVDGTYDIARNLNAKTVYRDFDNFASQKNYAASLARYQWVMSLDVDETASENLVKAIKTLPPIPLFSAFRIPRKNKIWGRYIGHTNWDPDGLVRLFDKTKCGWTGEVHEEITTEGTVGRLYDPIYHDNYRTAEEFQDRQNYYSSIEAGELSKKGTKFGYPWFFLNPLVDFFRRFIWHAGFLDGYHGLFLSYLMVIYHLSVGVKLWQSENSLKAS